MSALAHFRKRGALTIFFYDVAAYDIVDGSRPTVNPLTTASRLISAIRILNRRVLCFILAATVVVVVVVIVVSLFRNYYREIVRSSRISSFDKFC